MCWARSTQPARRQSREEACKVRIQLFTSAGCAPTPGFVLLLSEYGIHHTEIKSSLSAAHRAKQRLSRPLSSQIISQLAPAGPAAGSSWEADGCFPKGDFQKSLELDCMKGLLPPLVRTEPDSCRCVTKWVQMAPTCSTLPQHLGQMQGNSLGVVEVTRQFPVTLFSCRRLPFLQRSCWMLSGCCVGLEYCNSCG